MSRAEDERKRHQELLREIRLSCEDTKDYIQEKVEPRINSLEASRDFSRGVIKAVGVGVPTAGSVSWFVWQLIREIKNIKGGQ